MHFSQAIHFPECLLRYFLHIFQHDEFRDIFEVFFDTRYARVEKLIKNFKKFIHVLRKIVCQGKVNGQVNFH